MTATSILELLANPNVLTLVCTAIGSLVTWFAARTGTVKVSAGARPVLAKLIPAIEHAAEAQAKQQSHGALQDLAGFALRVAGELLQPAAPAPAAPAPAAKP